MPLRLLTSAVVLALLFSGCASRDEHAERFVHARAAYDGLLARAERPSAAAFDEVLRELESIPLGSRHGPEAQRLAEAIRRGRTHVPAPLALAPKAGRPAELEAVLAACARLATEAGRDGGLTPSLLSALEACRRRAEALELRFAHGLAVDGGHGHHE